MTKSELDKMKLDDDQMQMAAQVSQEQAQQSEIRPTGAPGSMAPQKPETVTTARLESDQKAELV